MNNQRAISRLVEDLFVVTKSETHNHKVNLYLSFRYERKKSTKILVDRLTMAGYKHELEEKDDYLYLQIDPKATFKIPRLNIILFILTFCSIYFVPVFLRKFTVYDFTELVRKLGWEDKQDVGSWDILRINLMAVPEVASDTLSAMAGGVGLEFTIAMISILFVHEMGHYIASRRRDIITSWPYFIPAPNIIGTFGAVIKSKSPFWNRRDLIEVGSWGPIAGWIVAVGWLIYGLSNSIVLPPDVYTEMGTFSLDGESILMRFAVVSIIGEVPAGYYYSLSEAAFAGWVGLLVTSINMLPIGQLDGGHVLYGLTKKGQHYLGIAAMVGLFIFGFYSRMWWFFAMFGILFGVKHPKTLDDTKKPGKPALILGLIAIFILIVSFTPVPFRIE